MENAQYNSWLRVEVEHVGIWEHRTFGLTLNTRREVFATSMAPISGMGQQERVFNLNNMLASKQIAFLLHNVISYQKIK